MLEHLKFSMNQTSFYMPSINLFYRKLLAHIHAVDPAEIPSSPHAHKPKDCRCLLRLQERARPVRLIRRPVRPARDRVAVPSVNRDHVLLLVEHTQVS